MHGLASWLTYYVVVATAAATLVGLMFVVITLIQGAVRPGERTDGFSVFTTPTLMHFCSALLIALTLIAPWRTAAAPSILVGVAAIGGLVYIARATNLLRRMESYEADTEDLVWYVILPGVIYLAQLAGAVLFAAHAAPALAIIAGAAASAIFVGIRNAWDVVTYLAVRRDEREN